MTRRLLPPGSVITDVGGQITCLDAAAARLLNISCRGAVGRDLILFFDGDRHEWRALAIEVHAAADRLVVRDGFLRARDKGRIRVTVDLRRTDMLGDVFLVWVLHSMATSAADHRDATQPRSRTELAA